MTDKVTQADRGDYVAILPAECDGEVRLDHFYPMDGIARTTKLVEALREIATVARSPVTMQEIARKALSLYAGDER